MTSPNATIEDGRSGRPTAPPKPGPRLNLIHSQILSALLDNKHLAQNVSEYNVHVIAKRWIP